MNTAGRRIRPVRLPTNSATRPAARRWQSTAPLAESSTSATPLTVRLNDTPYRLLTSVILTRSPLLTAEPTPYEAAYYAYNRRLARALSNPFPNEFYFKKGSVGERKFAIEDRERELQAFGEKARVSKKAEKEEEKFEGEDEVEKPVERKGEADRKGDVWSLDRRGERSLFLLLKEKGHWRFPQGEVMRGEALHKAAARDLALECGPNMHTWIVGRQPVGVFQRDPPSAATAARKEGDKVFFFKGHIMAGQAQPGREGVEDFAWLTSEEIEQRLEGEKAYWEAVRWILTR